MGDKGALVTIRTAAKLTGLTQKAIRHYESIGLCPPSARSDSGYRLYSQEAIRRLQQIQYFRKLKFGLPEIAALLDAPWDVLRGEMRRQRDYVETQLHEYRQALAVLNAALSSEEEPPAEAVDSPQVAVVAIDLQNDIMQGGALPCKRILDILPPLKTLFAEAHDLGVPVIYICDCHRKGDPELQLWNDHMMEGTYGAQIISEVEPQAGDYVVRKNLFNGFVNTDLQSVLDTLNVRTLLFAGWRTEVCVAQTAIEAFYRGYHVAIAEDGTSSTTQREHDYGMTLMQINYGFEAYPCAGALKTLLEQEA